MPRISSLSTISPIVGTETVPLDATATGKATVDQLKAFILASVATVTGDGFRFKDGNFQLWNYTTEKYHTLFLTGAEDAVQLNFGEGED